MNNCQTPEQVAAYMAKCKPHYKDYTDADEDTDEDTGAKISAAYLPRLLALRALVARKVNIRYLSDGTKVEVVAPFNGLQPAL